MLNMLTSILVALLISVIINLVGFIIAFKFKTDKLTDFSYSLSFITVNTTVLALAGDLSLAKFTLLFMVTLWALRLGTHLLIRIREWGSDNRFDAMRGDFIKFLSFWMIQAVTVWVVSVSSIQFFNLKSSTNFGIISALGILIFSKGLIIETVADISLFRFSKRNKEKGKDDFMQSGIWSISRHPNYLGEITVWLGLWIFTLQSVNLTQAIIGAISPIFIFTMLRFVSGTPRLEAKAEKKWGKQKDYLNYKRQTDLIFPSIKFIKTRILKRT
jgi:steroid 5-alpha reductase family enzyme